MKGRVHRTLYGPIKTFVVALSEKLARLYRQDGVRVQALCPGLTKTEFHQRLGESSLFANTPSWLWVTPEAVVAHSLKKLFHTGKTVVVPSWRMRLLVGFCRIIYGIKR